MEYLAGQNLMDWCEEASAAGYQEAWLREFKEAVYDALAIVTRFHQHGIVLIDFKPDNIIRLTDRGIMFVDLGAFFTPRHCRETDKYVYSATPDYAELLIDASNVQAGVPPTEASDIFPQVSRCLRWPPALPGWILIAKLRMKSLTTRPYFCSGIRKFGTFGSPIHI